MKKIVITLILFAGVQTFSQAEINNPTTGKDTVSTGLETVKNLAYIEDEENVELGFDTAQYLPKGFNPYVYYPQMSVIKDITYIAVEEQVEIADSSTGILSNSEMDFLRNLKYIEKEEALTLPSFSK
ncbi:MAG: hypothetical protein RQ735_08765 [Flavobacteriaceae bacterium]|nr:hypothetical protein [Flavobacteriaceae bacterium]